jgi:hypothetical protein
MLFLLDMDLTVAVLFEHALSSSHIVQFVQLNFRGANEAAIGPG